MQNNIRKFYNQQIYAWEPEPFGITQDVNDEDVYDPKLLISDLEESPMPDTLKKHIMQQVNASRPGEVRDIYIQSNTLFILM
jgi:hypothetical protein